MVETGEKHRDQHRSPDTCGCILSFWPVNTSTGEHPSGLPHSVATSSAFALDRLYSQTPGFLKALQVKTVLPPTAVTLDIGGRYPLRQLEQREHSLSHPELLGTTIFGVVHAQARPWAVSPGADCGPLVPSLLREFIRCWVWLTRLSARSKSIGTVDSSTQYGRQIKATHKKPSGTWAGARAEPLPGPRSMQSIHTPIRTHPHPPLPMPNAEKAWRANIPKIPWVLAGAPFDGPGCLS